MPIRNINRYTCAVTGNVEYGDELPPGWFGVENEVFSPDAKVLIANAIIANPAIEFPELLAALGSHEPEPEPEPDPVE